MRRRSLLAAGSAVLALPATGNAIVLATTTRSTLAGTPLGANFSRLLARVSRVGLIVQAGGHGLLQHGLLHAAPPPFAGAELFAGFPFGSTAEELQAWVSTPEGRAQWDRVWAGAGYRAFPCGVANVADCIWTSAPLLDAGDLMQARFVGGGALAREVARALLTPVGAAPILLALDLAGAKLLQARGALRHAYAMPLPFGRLVDCAVPLATWDAMPQGLRAALAEASATEFAAGPWTVMTDACCLPHAVQEALGSAMAGALRRIAANAEGAAMLQTWRAARVAALDRAGWA